MDIQVVIRRTKVIELELAKPLAPLGGLDGYASVQALVRLHGEPLGYGSAPVIGGVAPLEPLFDDFLERHRRDLTRALVRRWLALPWDARGTLRIAALPALARVAPPRPSRASLPTVSVVVCSRDRPADLARCLEHLRALDPAPLEIVVVDNAPASEATRELVTGEFADVARYVREPRPGLDWARSRGVLETRGEIVAFTDDDALVDPAWVGVLAGLFAEAPDVMAVTGLVAPAELETRAQRLFERYGGFGRGFRRRWFRRAEPARHPAAITHGAGSYGTGANMAYRRTLFELVGGFAPELDVGTPTNGGGDLEFFFRVLREGFALVYEPRALVWHRHRRGMAELTRQLADWGRGFWAYVTYARERYPDERRAFRHLGWWWLTRLVGPRVVRGLALRAPGELPAELALAELRGARHGASALRAARRQAAATARAFPHEPSLLPAAPRADALPPDTTRHAPRTAVRTVELEAPLVPLTGLAGYRTVELHLLRDGVPVGRAHAAVEGDQVSAAQLHDVLAERLVAELELGAEERIAASLRGWLHELAAAAHEPFGSEATARVSVVVATRNRPDDLRRCLAALHGQRTRHEVELVVVDNDPASGLTAPVLAEFPGVRGVAEPRPGLSFARNAGILAATGEIIAFTDDDVVVDEHWIERIAAPFARADVMVVTGNVLPAELETDAQHVFERYGGLGRGFRRREFGVRWFRRFRKAVPTWDIGATANAAVRASLFRDPAVGLMEEALGAGTPAPVGEDTYLFYRTLAAGYTVVYEPAAVVWHRHRRDLEGLRRQIFGYSAGHVAYHLITWRRDGDRRGLIRVLAELPLHDARLLWRVLRRRAPYPVPIALAEVLGHLVGPWAWWRAERNARRLGRTAPPAAPAEPSDVPTETPELSIPIPVHAEHGTADAYVRAADAGDDLDRPLPH